jgi:UDP-glucose 6-dehydrogenase
MKIKDIEHLEEDEVTEIMQIELGKDMTSASDMDSNFKSRKKLPHFTIKDAKLLLYVFEKDKNLRYVYAFLDKSYPVMEIEMKRFGESWVTSLSSVRQSVQGTGLGFAVYELLIKKGNMMLMSDKMQSLGAQKLWKRLFKTPGITVYGYDPNEKDSSKQYFQVHDLNDTDNLDAATRSLYTNWSDTYRMRNDRSKLGKIDRSDVNKAANTRLVAIKTSR